MLFRSRLEIKAKLSQPKPGLCTRIGAALCGYRSDSGDDTGLLIDEDMTKADYEALGEKEYDVRDFYREQADSLIVRIVTGRLTF